MPSEGWTKLTPEVEERILLQLRVGATLKDVAEANGITDRSLRNYVRAGREAEEGSPQAAFFRRYKEARATGKMALMARVFAASERDWRAAAWYLSVIDRKRFARPKVIYRAEGTAPPTGDLGHDGMPAKKFSLTLEVVDPKDDGEPEV